jgi:hypothetical protein
MSLVVFTPTYRKEGASGAVVDTGLTIVPRCIHAFARRRSEQRQVCHVMEHRNGSRLVVADSGVIESTGMAAECPGSGLFGDERVRSLVDTKLTTSQKGQKIPLFFRGGCRR